MFTTVHNRNLRYCPVPFLTLIILLSCSSGSKLQVDQMAVDIAPAKTYVPPSFQPYSPSPSTSTVSVQPIPSAYVPKQPSLIEIVQIKAAAPQAPSITLTVNGAAEHTSIPYNGQVTLQWTTQFASSCTLTSNKGLSLVKPVNGSYVTQNLTGSLILTLTCQNGPTIGTHQSVSIGVGPKPVRVFANPYLAGWPLDACTDDGGCIGSDVVTVARQYCLSLNQGYTTAVNQSSGDNGGNGTMKYYHQSGGDYHMCKGCSYYMTSISCQ